MYRRIAAGVECIADKKHFICGNAEVLCQPFYSVRFAHAFFRYIYCCSSADADFYIGHALLNCFLEHFSFALIGIPGFFDFKWRIEAYCGVSNLCDAIDNERIIMRIANFCITT